MGTCGKRIILDTLSEIDKDIEQFYGELNELKMNARSTPPKKPDILHLVEKIDNSGLPLVSGGYMDQPYLLTIYMEAARKKMQFLEYVQQLANSNAENQ